MNFLKIIFRKVISNFEILKMHILPTFPRDLKLSVEEFERDIKIDIGKGRILENWQNKRTISY
jgi:hypothetical protein